MNGYTAITRRIEFLAITERANVVHSHFVTLLGEILIIALLNRRLASLYMTW